MRRRERERERRKPTWRSMCETSQIHVVAYLRQATAAAIEALSDGGEEEIDNSKERYKDGADFLSDSKRT